MSATRPGGKRKRLERRARRVARRVLQTRPRGAETDGPESPAVTIDVVGPVVYQQPRPSVTASPVTPVAHYVRRTSRPRAASGTRMRLVLQPARQIESSPWSSERRRRPSASGTSSGWMLRRPRHARTTASRRLTVEGGEDHARPDCGNHVLAGKSGGEMDGIVAPQIVVPRRGVRTGRSGRRPADPAASVGLQRRLRIRSGSC